MTPSTPVIPSECTGRTWRSRTWVAPCCFRPPVSACRTAITSKERRSWSETSSVTARPVSPERAWYTRPAKPPDDGRLCGTARCGRENDVPLGPWVSLIQWARGTTGAGRVDGEDGADGDDVTEGFGEPAAAELSGEDEPHPVAASRVARTRLATTVRTRARYPGPGRGGGIRTRG